MFLDSCDSLTVLSEYALYRNLRSQLVMPSVAVITTPPFTAFHWLESSLSQPPFQFFGIFRFTRFRILRDEKDTVKLRQHRYSFFLQLRNNSKFSTVLDPLSRKSGDYGFLDFALVQFNKSVTICFSWETGKPLNVGLHNLYWLKKNLQKLITYVIHWLNKQPSTNSKTVKNGATHMWRVEEPPSATFKYDKCTKTPL